MALSSEHKLGGLLIDYIVMIKELPQIGLYVCKYIHRWRGETTNCEFSTSIHSNSQQGCEHNTLIHTYHTPHIMHTSLTLHISHTSLTLHITHTSLTLNIMHTSITLQITKTSLTPHSHFTSCTPHSHFTSHTPHSHFTSCTPHSHFTSHTPHSHFTSHTPHSHFTSPHTTFKILPYPNHLSSCSHLTPGLNSQGRGTCMFH